MKYCQMHELVMYFPLTLNRFPKKFTLIFDVYVVIEVCRKKLKRRVRIASLNL